MNLPKKYSFSENGADLTIELESIDSIREVDLHNLAHMLENEILGKLLFLASSKVTAEQPKVEEEFHLTKTTQPIH